MKQTFYFDPDREQFMVEVCKLLHEIRTLVGMKPAEVAGIAGFSEQTYKAMECGKTRSSMDLFIKAFTAMKIYPSLAQLVAEAKVNPDLPLKIEVDFLLKNRMPCKKIESYTSAEE